MRSQATTLVVLLLVAMVAAQQVITDFAEFQRKKAEYDVQKKRYDEYQALASVPLLAGYDLIPKVRDEQAPAGRAEQLLPNYTGEAIKFQEGGSAGVVEPGNSPQNIFLEGPIPKKHVSGPPPKPVVIPTGPGQDFVIPDDTSSSSSGPTEAAPAPAPSTELAPAPIGTGFTSAPAVDFASAPAPVTSFASSSTGTDFNSASFPTFASSPAPGVDFAASAASAAPASQQAIFFGRSVLPVQADAPLPASVSYAAPVRSFEGSATAVNVGLRDAARAARVTQFSASPVQFAPVFGVVGYQPAQSYGPPGFVR